MKAPLHARPVLLRWLAPALFLVGLGALGSGIGCRLTGLRINTSPSIPVGVYRLSAAPVAKGAYVIFCPPRTRAIAVAYQRGYIGAGFCPGGYGYLMKKVLAAKADRVRFAADGVRVNGRLLASSAALAVDGDGRPLTGQASGSHTLAARELLLMSPRSRTAFDARYFGLVRQDPNVQVIEPVLTWQGEDMRSGSGAAAAVAVAAYLLRATINKHLWAGLWLGLSTCRQTTASFATTTRRSERHD